MTGFIKHQWGQSVLFGILLALTVSACSSIEHRADDKASAGFEKTEVQDSVPLVERGSISVFSMKSELLSEFYGKETEMRASVVTPSNSDFDDEGVFCYNIAGFGGSYTMGFSRGKAILKGMESGSRPRMYYVYLDGNCPGGHHVYADSKNNGPWGQALIEEFIPVLENHFSSKPDPSRRFLTGHSSGGWSSLWLQVNYPEMFNGVWSTAPDPVDFRDFVGINIYDWENVFVDPDGQETQLERDKNGWSVTVREYVTGQLKSAPANGQWASFNGVYSAKGTDGKPENMHDWKTGIVNKDVVEHWKQYDISLKVRQEWNSNADLLRGKIHVYVGELDTIRLEGAVKLFRDELEKLNAGADIRIVPGRTHFNLHHPSEKEWKEGMMTEIHRQMWRKHLHNQ